MTFDSFETEEYQDLVTVLDGGPAENSSMVIAILSGTEKPGTLISSTNVVIVNFNSDSHLQARGFQASWRAGFYIHFFFSRNMPLNKKFHQ